MLFRAPERQHWRMQELLPRMRTHRIAEQRRVLARLQTVGSSVLLIGPAFRQVGNVVDVVVDNGAAADGRTDYAEVAPLERVNERLQPLYSDDAMLFENDGMSLWFGTADAPGPAGGS